MHIIMVSRYFYPEVVLVNNISRWLVQAGHTVEVLTGQPDYNPEAGFARSPAIEDYEGVIIRRFSPFRVSDRGWRRNANNVLFVLYAAFRVLLGPKAQAVWSSSIPPIIQPLLLRLASRVRGGNFVLPARHLP